MSESIKRMITRLKSASEEPRFWWSIAFVLFCIIILKYCSLHKNQHRDIPSPVVIATSRKMDVPVYINALGLVTPEISVTVKTQITGQLMSVFYKEGQFVKKGDLIALIDPRPYQAQLLQYQGQLLRDTALLENAKLDLARYQKLWQQNSIAKQVLDTQTALVKQDEGTVQIDQGLIAVTKVNLIYCNITAPTDGQIGIQLVNPGNLVQTSDTTGIAVINLLNPIDVIFSIPEDSIPAVLKQTNAGNILNAEAYDRMQQTLLATGRLLTVDNQIDPTTGMVKVKAVYDNKNHLLFPNQFVNVKLRVDLLHDVVTVPTAAIQHTAQDTYVYVIQSGHTAHKKIVIAGITYNNDTVIQQGLAAGQSVVVEGADKLVDNAKIAITH